MYKGASCFLICDGPSFLNIDTKVLETEGIVTMGVNNSPKTFRPMLWCSVDSPGTFLESIKKDQKIIKFVPRGYRNKYENPAILFSTNTNFAPNRFLCEESVNYGDNKENGGGRSVMLAAIKILYVLGFKNVFLLGVDFKMKQGEMNYHFEQDTNNHSIRSNNNTYEKLIKRFELLRPIFEENNFYIYNCNEKSKLKVFDFIGLNDAIEKAKSDIPNPKNETTKGMYDNPRRRDLEGKRERRIARMSNNKRSLNAVTQYLISGISRSGTHAFSNWVCSQKSGNVQFRNDLHHTNGKICNPENRRTPSRFYELPSLKYETGSVYKKIDSFVYTYENYERSKLESCQTVISDNTIKIQLLRDPYNLLASLAKHVEQGRKFWFWKNCVKNGKIDDVLLYNFSKLWKTQANIFLNDKSVESVSYNSFVKSESYRDELFDRLLLDRRTDESLRLVPVNGGGSSFDKRDLNGDGGSMDTLNRWVHYKDDEWFVNFFKNHDDVRLISDKIFGEIVSL